MTRKAHFALRSCACLFAICILQLVQNAHAAADPLQYLKDHTSDYNTELIDLVNIPSISSLPDHQDDIVSAATWLNMRLGQAGLQVRVCLQYHCPGQKRLSAYLYAQVCHTLLCATRLHVNLIADLRWLCITNRRRCKVFDLLIS